MLIERFEVPGLAHYSYAIGCTKAGAIMVVDPESNIEGYLKFAAEQKVQITHILETHIHADFASGGMENSDGVSSGDALLREIIEERYVSGFGTYMPFNDHRRLRGDGETNLIPPFSLNTTAATAHVERIPYAQDELTSNSTMDDDPGLYVQTEVNQ